MLISCLYPVQIQERLEAEFQKQAEEEIEGAEAETKEEEYRKKAKALKEAKKNPEAAAKIPGFIRPVLIEGTGEKPIVIMSEDKKWVGSLCLSCMLLISIPSLFSLLSLLLLSDCAPCR